MATIERPARPRRSRGTTAALVVLVIAAMVLTAWWRAPAPVGHFTSAEARDRYATAYGEAMAELPPPDATLDVRTGFGVVRMYRFDGPTTSVTPLVLLSGRAAASPMWADNLDRLQAIRTVYLVDLLGEPGASVQDRPITDAADQAAWLDQALAALPADRVHLLGASIGGWTAMNQAVRRPDRIASVTVLDPVMTFAGLAPEAVVRSIPASVRWLPRTWRDGFASWTAGGVPIEDEPIARLIETGMQTYRMATPGPARFTEGQLAGVEVPVLAVMAGRSVMHDSAEATATARALLPGAWVRQWADATHALNGEFPGRVADEVASFTGRIGR